MILNKYLKLFTFFSFISLSSLGGAMSLFKEKCLFSSVDGIILDSGKPVKGVEVEQYYNWQGPDKSNKKLVKTDNEGRFHFPAIYDNSVLSTIFPHNPSIQQEINIRYKERSYEGYLLMKGNYDEKGELDGQAIHLICDLQNEPSRDGGFYGICT